MSIPTKVWYDISLNFIEGLPLSHKFSVILVVVDRLSMRISFQLRTLTQLLKLHISLLPIFLNYMECRVLLLVSGIQYSLAYFGRNCSNCMELSLNFLKFIIHKRMVKWRLLISVWSSIYGVFQVISQKIGLGGCLLLSGGIIQTFMFLPK